jgi:hypothetical protein
VKDKLRKIATEVRAELVRLGPKIYGVTPGHLGGLCGYGSVMLFQRLKKEGYSPKIASGIGHWFVVCGDFLVDVTASQFGQGKVTIRNYKNIKKKIESGNYSLDFWKATKLSKTLKESGLASSLERVKRARGK